MPDPTQQSISATQASRLPTLEELDAAFALDRETGTLTWKWRADVPKRTNSLCCGRAAGVMNSAGYLICKMRGRIFAVHRIVFKIVHGYEPPQVDHADGNRLNNRPDNLRAATSLLNNRNRKPRANRALPKGVFHGRPGKYRARIMADGRSINLGTFDTPHEAHAARIAASRVYHQHFGREG